MKKVSALLTGFFFLLLSFTATAQTKTGADYYAGKWNVLLKGTPQGDSKLLYVLDNKDGKITGVVQDTTGKELTKITNAEIKGDEITLYFTMEGYDLNVALKKKDDDHATGSMLGMFDVDADRVKATKPTK